MLSLEQFDFATSHIKNVTFLDIGGLGAVLVLPLIQSKVCGTVFAGDYFVVVIEVRQARVITVDTGKVKCTLVVLP